MENYTEQDSSDLQKQFADEPEQTQHDPVQPVRYSESASSKSNPIYLYALIGLLVLMVIGMFLLRQMDPIIPTPTTQMPLSPTEVPVSQIFDATANWRTLDQSGWTFKVPEDWKYLRCEKYSELIFVGPQDESWLKEDRTDTCQFDASPGVISFSKLSDPNQFTLPVSSTEFGLQVTQQKTIMVGGIPATQQIHIQTDGPGAGTRKNVYIQKDGQVYVISLQDMQLETTFDQIVSTFKFTDQISTNVPPLNWKTYTNDTYRFKMAYPPTGEGPTGTTISCGDSIHEYDLENPSLGHNITFDNYFGIFVIKGFSSVQSYLDKYSLPLQLTPISIKGADEAYQTTVKEGGTTIFTIMRKGSNIIRLDNNNGIIDGCFKPEDWQLTQNFSLF